MTMKNTIVSLKKMLALTLIVMCSTFAMAQPHNDGKKGGPHRHFSPEEYVQKGMAYVTAEAKLSQAEASKFFPVYLEMRESQRKLNMEKGKLMWRAAKETLSDSESLTILKKIMDIEDDILDVEEDYQKKFLKILPASKYLKVKLAIQRFERKMLREVAKGPKCPPPHDNKR